MLVVLALLDVVNNLRISASARQEFRAELQSLEEDVRRVMAERQAEMADEAKEGPDLRLTENERPEPNE